MPEKVKFHLQLLLTIFTFSLRARTGLSTTIYQGLDMVLPPMDYALIIHQFLEFVDKFFPKFWGTNEKPNQTIMPSKYNT
jgi:hypothetical protein